jgi:hypothetical protein
MVPKEFLAGPCQLATHNILAKHYICNATTLLVKNFASYMMYLRGTRPFVSWALSLNELQYHEIFFFFNFCIRGGFAISETSTL